jgi:endonuclease-3
MAAGDIAEIEEIVRPCGLFRTKAKSIKEMSEIIVSRVAGEIPREMDDLLALPGVGRKIANLIRGDLYGLGGIVADTHCIRICGRLGFYPESEKDAHKVEKVLTPLVPTEEQTDLCHRLVWFGRETCIARSPQCDRCPLAHLCKGKRK